MSKLDKMSQDIEDIKTKVALIQQDAVYIKERVTKIEGTLYTLAISLVLSIVGVVISFITRK